MTHMRPTRKELHALAQDEQRSVARRAHRTARIADCAKCRTRGPVFTAKCLKDIALDELCETCVTFEIARADRAKREEKLAAENMINEVDEDFDDDE